MSNDLEGKDSPKAIIWGLRIWMICVAVWGITHRPMDGNLFAFFLVTPLVLVAFGMPFYQWVAGKSRKQS